MTLDNSCDYVITFYRLYIIYKKKIVLHQGANISK
jgi:hypothetical protein